MKIFGTDIAQDQVANVAEFLQSWVDLAYSIAKDRQDSNLALLAKVNEGIPGPSDSSVNLYSSSMYTAAPAFMIV